MNLLSALWSAMAADDNMNDHALSPRRVTPYVIDPLPVAHRRGLIAVAVTSFISTITTAALFGFITYRFIFWRRYSSTYTGYNQYIVLIFNLIIADFQQALGFLLALQWVVKNRIDYKTPTCFIQGWLLQVGDPSSGLFVLAIAVHTYAMVLMGKKLPYKWFVAAVVGVWAFAMLLVLIPTGRHGRYTYVPSGAWCWIDENYEYDRLWCHYVWIFLAEFGSVVLYTVLFFHLRRQVAASAMLGRSQTEKLRRLKRVIGYMILYPIAYIVLSLPLAAGRMAMAKGDNMSISYLCAAGAIIATSGFADVIMYTLTRRALLSESEPSNPERMYNYSARQQNSHIATITAENKYARKEQGILHRRTATDDDSSGLDRDGSTDNIVQNLELADMGKVYQKTTIEITSEVVVDEDNSTSNSMNESRVAEAPGNLWMRR